MMIGMDTLWSDPWLFGVAIWPGLTLVRPWLERKAAASSTDSSGEQS
jgi:hypothetical protein